MTRARLDEVAPDPAAARRLVIQARAHLASAAELGSDPQGAYGLCYQGVLKAMIAVLMAEGRRVTSGAGAHVLILGEGLDRLSLDSAVADRIDYMRRERHRVFYDALEVTALELEGALRDAQVAVAAAAVHLEVA